MSADECKSLALRSKLALHVNFDESCAEVAYYLRIELEPGPSRVYRLLDLPVATCLTELDVLVEPISIEGRVQPSSELVVRGARALRIAIDMEHAASGPQLRAERTKSAILLHAPNVLPYPENARKNRKFLVILHGVAAYVRTPPYDVHVLLLPRPYSLNNRILVTASDSVLDLYEPFGPAAVDAEPPILGNNKPTRRIKDAGADDTTTFRGSEYGADEVDGLSFSGGFEGSRRPITLRWGPAAEDLAYMDVEKAACTLSLVPQGDVGHPTYFAFECVVRLADLHLPWIAEGGVVSVDVMFAHDAERVVRFDQDGVGISPARPRDKFHTRSAGETPLPAVRTVAPVASVPASSSMDDSDLLHIAPPANLDAMDGSVLATPPWVPPPDEGEDGCDILLDAHRVFDPHSTAIITLRGLLALLPHHASPVSRAGVGAGLVSFTAPMMRVRQARNPCDLNLRLDAPLLADPQQSDERGAPVFVWETRSDTLLPARRRTHLPSPLPLTQDESPPYSVSGNGNDVSADLSNTPSPPSTTKPEPDAAAKSTRASTSSLTEVWLPAGQITLLQGRSGTILCRLTLAVTGSENVIVTLPPQAKQLRTLSHQPLVRPLSGEVLYSPAGLEWTFPPLDTVPLPTLTVGVGKLTVLFNLPFSIQPSEVVFLACPGGEAIHSLPPLTPLVLIPSSKHKVRGRGWLMVVAVLALVIVLGQVVHLKSNLAELEHQVRLLTMAANLDTSDGTWSPDPTVYPPPPTAPHFPAVVHTSVASHTPQPEGLVKEHAHQERGAERGPEQDRLHGHAEDHTTELEEEDWLDTFLSAEKAENDAGDAVDLAPNAAGPTEVGFGHAIFRLVFSPIRLALASLAMILDRLAP